MTQPSSISVASGSHSRQQTGPAPNGNRRTVAAALVGVLLGASVLASALVYRQTQNAKKNIASEGSASPTVPELGATTPPHAPSTVAEQPRAAAPATPLAEGADAGVIAADPNPAPPVVVAPVGTTSKGPGKTPGATTRPATTTKPPVAPPVAPPPTAPPDCATPYWFDAQGVKHYKPQCFDKGG